MSYLRTLWTFSSNKLQVRGLRLTLSFIFLAALLVFFSLLSLRVASPSCDRMTSEAREQKRFFLLSKGKEAFSAGWVYRNFRWNNGRCSAHSMGQAHAQTTWQLIEESHLLGFTQGISLWDTSPATPGVQVGERQLFYIDCACGLLRWYSSALHIKAQWLYTQALGNAQADPEQLTDRWQKHAHWCRE